MCIRDSHPSNPKVDQATIPRIKIPIPVVIPRTNQAQDTSHTDSTGQGQYTYNNRSVTPKPTQAQDTRHPDPMEEEHHNYDNKSLLEQGLGRGSRLRATQGEKQKEASEHPGQGLGRGSRFFTNLGSGEKQKEAPVSMEVEAEGARASPEEDGKYAYLYDDYEDDGFPTREQCKRLYQSR